MNLKFKTKMIIPVLVILGLAACGSSSSESNTQNSTEISVETSIETSVGTSVGNSVGTSVGNSVGTSVGNSVGNSVGSSVGTSVGTSNGTSTSTPNDVITSWSSADKAIMNRVLGELLPLAPFITYTLTEEDIDGATVQIVGNDVEVASQYSAILSANGYIDGGFSEGVYFSYKSNGFENEYIDVEVFEDEGDTWILAYITIDEEEPDDGDEPLSDWPSDLKDYMLDTLGLILPVGKFTSEYINASEPGEVYIYEDLGNAYPSYKYLLENIGLVFVSSSTGVDGYLGDYTVYTHAKDMGDGTFVIVEITQFDYLYFDVYAYIDDSAVIPPPESVFVTKSTQEIADEYNWIDTNSYLNFSLTNLVTVSCTGVSGGSWGLNSGKYYYDDSKDEHSYRIYQNESAELTISVQSGYELISVVLTYEFSQNGVVLSDSIEYASGTAIPASGSSITLMVGATNGGTKGNIQITAFAVTYIAI